MHGVLRLKVSSLRGSLHSISGPVYRIDINKQNHLKEALIRIRKKMSKRLGYDEKL